MILGQYSIAQLVKPTLSLETCPQVPVPNECDNGPCGTHLEADPACVARNSEKERKYGIEMGVYTRATQLLGSNNQTLVKPTEPKQEPCLIINGADDPACTQRNQAKRQEYSTQLASYNQTVQLQNQAIQTATAEQQQISQIAGAASARAAAEEAQKKNKESSDLYKTASIGCAGASAYFANSYMGCKSSCMAAIYMSVTCISTTCTPILYKSIAFAGLAGLAYSQVSSNESSGYQACLASNQLASDGGANCGAPPSSYNPQSFPSNQRADLGKLFDSNGKCIGNPASCTRVINGLPSGMSAKDALKALDDFDKNNPFTIDKNGNITAGGKTYAPSDFADEAAMMAAGLSAADAKALAAKLKGNALDLAKGFKGSGGSAFGDNGGGSSLAGGKGSAANGNASLEKNIGGGEKPRELASFEGLAKEYNGTMIGVAGDNIFKMMNRRYKLKVAQDIFIAPTP